MPPDFPPVITLKAAEGTDRVWTFSGKLTSSQGASQCSVFLWGEPQLTALGTPPPDGTYQACETNDDGDYSIDVQLAAGDKAGYAYAQGTDIAMRQSNIAEDYVDPTQ